MKSSIYV